MDARVFNLNSKRYLQTTLPQCYIQNKKEKNKTKRCYKTIFVENVKCFMLNLQNRYLRKKGNKSIIATIWIPTKITFALMKSVLLCLLGSRSLNKNVRKVEDDKEI